MKPTTATRKTVFASEDRDREKRLLRAVNDVATALLTSDVDSFESSLGKGMEVLARRMDVDRVYIWRNDEKDGDLHYVQVFEWLNDIGREGKTVRVQTGFPYAQSIPEWKDRLRQGECTNGPLSLLSKRERECLEPYGIKSILVIPVHLQEGFWGFISFDDCRRERVFAEHEVNILRSGSLMLANAMIRNEALVRMREADERTKIMLDAMPLCCTLWDRDFNNIDCNEEAVQLFGLRDKQEYLDSFSGLSPTYQPDGQLSSEKIVRLIREAYEKGRVVFEWMHQKPDGTPIPSEITFVRVRFGNEHFITGYTRDLRECKEMMREIEHQDALLHTVNNVATILLQSEIDEFENELLRCMGMMAESVGVDRVYIWKNHNKGGKLRCTQLYEWSGGAQPQQGKQHTIDVSYADSVPGWEEMLSSGRCVNSLVRDLTPKEQAILSIQDILSILVVPVFLREQFWGYVGFDDCHNERLFSAGEESILRSGSLLVAHALLRNEMTRDIRAAVEQAQAASRAKSNFLSNMSHEIRTPINAVIGMTQIGKSACETEKKDYAFEKVEMASNHLLGVINDILDMSKIEASKFELSETGFIFGQILQKAIDVIKFDADEKKHGLSVRLDKRIPRILLGDAQRLTQVIVNLLSNAVKFTPEGGAVLLDTCLVNEADGVCTIRIEVADTGIGINPEQQARLFRSFEQGENSTSRKFGGTGLGLAISKHIIELMGGDIWVDSEIGKGSVFSFTIRVRRGAEECQSNDVSQKTDCIAATPAETFKGQRILLAEDVEINREIVLAMLEATQLEIDCATNGVEAVRMFDAAPDRYDMIFMDMQMPEMDGLEATRRIRALDFPKAVTIPIVAITANVFREDIEKCIGAGMNGHLGKPLLYEEVFDTLKQYLEHKSNGNRPPEECLTALTELSTGPASF